MRMRKKLIAIIGTLMLVLALVPGVVMATPDTAERDLPDSVLVNAEFDVTITLETTFGQVVETLPANFAFVSCAAGSNMPEGGVSATVDGQVVTFTFFASATPATFTYTVTAPSSPVTGATFSGVLKPSPDEATWSDVGGDTAMDVTGEAGPAADRDLPPSVLVNAEFDVEIDISNAQFGQVVETLPANFAFVTTDTVDVQCEVISGMPEGGVTGEITGAREATFTFFASSATASSFKYSVTAPSSAVTGAAFAGVLKVGPEEEYPVGGDSTMNVTPAAVPAADRDLPDSVVVNAEFEVEIDMTNVLLGQVVETLPEDFAFVTTDTYDVQCEIISGPEDAGLEGVVSETNPREATFTFFAATTASAMSFKYSVTAPGSTVDDAAFAGVLKVGPEEQYDVGGDTTMDVTPAVPATIQLYEGMTVVSVYPGIDADLPANLPAEAVMVWHQVTADEATITIPAGTWLSWAKGVEPQFNSLDSLEYGKAYLVSATADCVWTYPTS